MLCAPLPDCLLNQGFARARTNPCPAAGRSLDESVGEVLYGPPTVQVGRLVEGDDRPRIEPASPGADGSVDFLAAMQEYEGGSWRTGRAVIGAAEDGRMVVTELEILGHGWSC